LGASIFRYRHWKQIGVVAQDFTNVCLLIDVAYVDDDPLLQEAVKALRAIAGLNVLIVWTSDTLDDAAEIKEWLNLVDEELFRDGDPAAVNGDLLELPEENAEQLNQQGVSVIALAELFELTSLAEALPNGIGQVAVEEEVETGV